MRSYLLLHFRTEFFIFFESSQLTPTQTRRTLGVLATKGLVPHRVPLRRDRNLRSCDVPRSPVTGVGTVGTSRPPVSSEGLGTTMTKVPPHGWSSGLSHLYSEPSVRQETLLTTKPLVRGLFCPLSKVNLFSKKQKKRTVLGERDSCFSTGTPRIETWGT